MYVIIVGCGRVGAELARLLSAGEHNVVIVDEDETSFKRLGPAFNGLTLVGSGFDLETLRSAGAERADAFCALTDTDNTNIMAVQAARKIFKIPKAIVRVHDPQKAQVYRSLGLDVFSGTILFASMIRDKIIESRFSSYLIETGELGILEIEVKDKLAGKKVAELNMPEEFLVATIIKKKGTIIPEPTTVVEKGDILMGVVKTASLQRTKKNLGLPT